MMSRWRRVIASTACVAALGACSGPGTKDEAEKAARQELVAFCRREACVVEKFEMLPGTQEDGEWSVEFRTAEPKPLRIVFTFQRNGFVNTSTLQE
jgi:hypothetical protein